MRAGIRRWVLEYNDNFKHIVVWKNALGQPIDMTGWTAVLEFRDTRTGSLLFSYSSSGSEIDVNSSTGTITIDVPYATLKSDIDDNSFESGFYKLRVTKDDDSNRLLEGPVNVSY